MTDMEALGQYFYHKELADSHLTCMQAAVECLQDMLERTGQRVAEFNVDRGLRMLSIADKARASFLQCATKANEAAAICGRPPLEI
jgi:phage gp16-like protein